MQLHAAVVTKRSLALALIHQLDTTACGNKLTLFILYQHCQSARPLSTRRRPANLLLRRPNCYADLQFVDVLDYAYQLARYAMHACITNHLHIPHLVWSWLAVDGIKCHVIRTRSVHELHQRQCSPTPVPPFTYTLYNTLSSTPQSSREVNTRCQDHMIEVCNY